MLKEIVLSSEARLKIKEGVDAIANAVRVTLGPKGKNVILDKNYITPLITKDGVTVATHINLNERLPNIGVTFLKDISRRTAEISGDGTTSTIVIAQALYGNGLKEIEQNNFNSIDIQRGMKKASAMIIDGLRNMAVPVRNLKDMYDIAYVSSNGDKEIANIVSEVVYTNGSKANIMIKDSSTYDTYQEYVDGIRFDAGYMNYHFCNVQEHQKCVFENPYILISLDKIGSYGAIERFVIEAYKQKRPLVIVTEEMSEEVISVLLANKQMKDLKICVVSAPGVAGHRRELLEDMAVVTGGKLFGNNTGYPFHKQDMSSIGTCKSIVVDRNNTTFFINDDEDIKAGIDKRINEIVQHRELNDGIQVKQLFDNRIAALKSKVAIINVGGFTDTEVKERKDRFDDSIRACKAALEEGTVEGSGITYIKLANDLRNTSLVDVSINEMRGFNIVLDSINQVFNQVAINCGLTPEVILNNIQRFQLDDASITGYDFRDDVYCNLRDFGVIDPVKVLRVALENAVSVTCLMLTTEAVVMNKFTEIDMDTLNRSKHLNSKQYE